MRPSPPSVGRQAQVAQRLVERTVLHHQHDDVVDVGRKGRVGQRRAGRLIVPCRQHRTLRPIPCIELRNVGRRLPCDLGQIAAEEVAPERTPDRLRDLAQFRQVLGGVAEVVGATDEPFDERRQQHGQGRRHILEIDERPDRNVAATVGPSSEEAGSRRAS